MFATIGAIIMSLEIYHDTYKMKAPSTYYCCWLVAILALTVSAQEALPWLDKNNYQHHNAATRRHELQISEIKRQRNLKIASRIIGGTNVTDTEALNITYSPFPFFVDWTSQGCGAVLVASNLLLTAAHCYNESGSTKATVYLGGKAQRQRGIKGTIQHLYRHPRFNATNMAYDFMLLKFTTNETFKINQIPPVVINRDPLYPPDGMKLTVVGFGGEGTGFLPVLQYAQVKHYEPTTCNFLLQFTASADVADNIVVDYDVMLCGGSTIGEGDSCGGDSGGPLLDDNNLLVGIISYGATVCGTPLIPGIYSRVSAVTDWIDQMTCIHSPASVQNRSIVGHKGCGEVAVHIYHDEYPEELSLSVVNAEMEEVYYSIEEGEFDTAEPLSESKMILHLPPGQYFVLIEDTGDDGNCCEYGEGNITVVVGKETYFEEGSFGTEVMIFIEVPAFTPAPTPMPTWNVIRNTPSPVAVGTESFITQSGPVTHAPVTSASVTRPPRPPVSSIPESSARAFRSSVEAFDQDDDGSAEIIVASPESKQSLALATQEAEHSGARRAFVSTFICLGIGLALALVPERW